jgi:hypothetical protein
LKKNKLLKLIQNEQPEPEATEAKEEHQMKVIRAKRIIVDSIKDHVIPIMSSKKTCMMLSLDFFKGRTSTRR